MVQVHITEAELASDTNAVLERVRQGAEVIVERGAQAVAVISPPRFRGRSIDECIVSARARGSRVTPDEEFAKDVEEGIRSHQESFNPPSWD